MFITVHIGANRSFLPRILSQSSRLPVSFAGHEDGFGNAVYLAPADRHLIIGRNKVSLSEGPRENHTRPAIDPMFRSAAQNHGARVIGILLTGYLYDGVNGLHEIHRAGGRTIVQHPTDAEVPDIPLNALRRLSPDYLLPVSEIPGAVAQEVHAKRQRTVLGGSHE